MRKIIRNPDDFDPRRDSMVHRSMYSQKDTNSSSCSIAASEITDAINSMSDRVINSVSELGSKFTGLDKLVSGISSGSMFSAFDNRQRFSNQEGSGIKSLSRSSDSIKEEELSPLAVRNALSEGSNVGYMQSLSYIASPQRKQNRSDTILLNKISNNIEDISKSTYIKNNTLDKIFKLLDDKLDYFYNDSYKPIGTELNFDTPGRSRNARQSPKQNKKLASRTSGGKFGLGSLMKLAGGALAVDMAAEASETFQQNPELKNEALKDLSDKLGYSDDPTLASLNEPEKPATIENLNRKELESVNKESNTKENIKLNQIVPNINNEEKDILKENTNQTSLLKEEVSLLRDMKRYFDNKSVDDRFREIEEGITKYNSSSSTSSTQDNTSTGSTGASISESSPLGSPTQSTMPIEGMGASSDRGEPGVDDSSSSSGNIGGNANPSVDGYLSVMKKNAQGSSYSQPGRMGENSYDCSSFVSRSLQESGFDIRPNNTTQTLGAALSKIGFSYTPLPIPAKTTRAPSELKAGDILLNPGHHVETYAGNNQIVGAHSSRGGVSLKGFYSTGYPGYWRLGGGGASSTSNTSTGASGMTGGGYTPSAGGGTGELLSRGQHVSNPPSGAGLRGGYSNSNNASTDDLLSKGRSTSNSTGFGSLLSKYETGGRGTSQITNSKGDKGGASYGKFQLSHKMGSLKEFMSTLQKEDPQAYSELMPLYSSAGQGSSGAFGQKWKELASQGRLQKSEESYARRNYVQGGMSKLRDKSLIQRINANPALQEAFLSTTVQHGPSGGASIWNKAASGNMSDEDIIRNVYAERGRTNADGSLAHFSGNSASIQRGVANRFKNEVKDALALNAQYKSGNYTGQISGGKLSSSAQQMNPNIGRYSQSSSGENISTGIEDSGGGDMGGTPSGGGAGSEIPSYINDITLMALQTQLMYDQ